MHNLTWQIYKYINAIFSNPHTLIGYPRSLNIFPFCRLMSFLVHNNFVYILDFIIFHFFADYKKIIVPYSDFRASFHEFDDG